MPQFDVYENLNPASKIAVPYLLDVQADVLASLTTRVLVPLVAASAIGKPVKYLNPQFKIEGTPVIMSTAQLAGVDQHLLGKKITSLRGHRSEILASLDFLLTGF